LEAKNIVLLNRKQAMAKLKMMLQTLVPSFRGTSVFFSTVFAN